jgi:hypothetical protein
LKKRYIHRLHVLNPLTNSDIIGAVNYYLVKPQVKDEVVISIDAEVGADSDNKQEAGEGKNADDSSASKKEEAIDTPEPKPLQNSSSGSAEQVSNRISRASSPQRNTQRRISLICTEKAAGDITDQKPLARLDEPVDLTVAQHRVAFEDEGMNRVIPNGMQIFAKRRATVSDPQSETVTKVYPAARKKAGPGLVITTQVPKGQVSMTPTQPKSAVPLGRVTRFNVPVPEEQLVELVPKTQSGQRRSFSYANAVSAAGRNLTFLEWTAIAQQEAKASKSPKEKENSTEDYDIVSPVSSRISSTVRGSPPKKSIISPPSGVKSIPEEEEAAQPAEKETEEEIAPTEELVCYDAVYIANDTDFLESSKIRKLFRENACSAEDAKLFEMKEYTGKEEDENIEIMGDGFPCECCYPTAAELEAMNPCLKFLHVNKCILIAAVITLIVLSFVIVTMLTGLRIGNQANAPIQ